MFLVLQHKATDFGSGGGVRPPRRGLLYAAVPVLLTLLVFAPNLKAEATHGTVIFARDDVVVARSWALESATNIKAVTDAGQTITIAHKDVLALSAGSITSQPARFPRVVLQNGEIIAAELAEQQKTGQVVFASVAWGELRVSLERVVRYDAVVATTAEDPPPAPFVLLKNGDALAAELKRIGSEDLTIGTEFGDTPIARSSVAAIVLADEPPPTDGRDGDVFLIELSDGQRIYCDQVGPGEDHTITLARGEARCQVNQRDVQRIIWPGAAIGYPSSMKFTAKGVGYFGRNVSTERDHNAIGRPLRIGQRWFARGIGTRPQSQVSLRLDGRWAYLHGWVGLDPRLGRSGHCIVAVTVDEREAFKAELHRAGTVERLIVPLRGAGRIELDTDFGPSGDLGDYVNWCDLLLVGVKRGADK